MPKCPIENLFLYELPEKIADVYFHFTRFTTQKSTVGILTPWLEELRNNGTRIYVGDLERHERFEERRYVSIVARQLTEDARKGNRGYDSSNAGEFCR